MDTFSKILLTMALTLLVWHGIKCCQAKSK